MIPILQTQFVQVALPIVSSIFVALWWQNKRLDDIVARLDRMEARLDRIEKKLDDHTERIARVEERTGLVKVK